MALRSASPMASNLPAGPVDDQVEDLRERMRLLRK